MLTYNNDKGQTLYDLLSYYVNIMQGTTLFDESELHESAVEEKSI